MTQNESFQRLYDIIVRLRGPEGCPWDREQTPLSIRGNLIEETYECIEAINENESGHIKEELGDIFLLAILLSYMHEQEGLFSVAEVIDGLCEKLIRRHPHVFSTASASSPDEALMNWTRIKVEQEGRKPKDSVLDEVSGGFPPLERAWKLQKKAAKAGFDWPDAAGVIAKLKEELAEVEASIAAGTGRENTALEGELGDLLFSSVNLCRFFDIEPSAALQRTNKKFTERFKYVEKRMKEDRQEMKAQNLAVMDKYWDEAKKLES
ncbi:MAG: nucleoside triphosphate pyrophosphohydrolase [Treponema sp.]|jgi:tetrapyrrole methylase family protein/MazG family protein|nr:nucleoside triphosphate pyrophosphohydrolase [Treponema sp.]